MRKLSFFLLLASAAVPALAAPGDDGDSGERRGHRGEASSEQSESRPQRVRAERSDNGEQRAIRAQRIERAQSADQGAQSAGQGTAEGFRARALQRQQTTAGASDNDSVWRRAARNRETGIQAQQQQGSGWQARQRQIRTIPDTQPGATAQTTQHRGGLAQAFQGRPRQDYQNGNYTRWSSNRWRNDHRYNWWDYRNRNRSIFRLGFYYDPFGWSYRRWSIGSLLYPSYYGSNFWLDDPWQYRLPPAYGPYRWVRYWDDALLVNIYTGEVVDVINNFFW